MAERENNLENIEKQKTKKSSKRKNSLGRELLEECCLSHCGSGGSIYFEKLCADQCGDPFRFHGKYDYDGRQSFWKSSCLPVWRA